MHEQQVGPTRLCAPLFKIPGEDELRQPVPRAKQRLLERRATPRGLTPGTGTDEHFG